MENLPVTIHALVKRENLNTRKEIDKHLKPCPFCGCPDVKLGADQEDGFQCYMVHVFCMRCNCKGPPVLIGRDQTTSMQAVEVTRKRWNSRGFLE